MSAIGTEQTWVSALHMSAFGGTADWVRFSFNKPNKIRHFLQSIFPATRAGKTMGRPVVAYAHGPPAYVGKAGPRSDVTIPSLFWGQQNLPSLCDLLHIWHSPLLLVCKHANRGNRLRGTGISSRWHADDRNHDLDCCSGSPSSQ